MSRLDCVSPYQERKYPRTDPRGQKWNGLIKDKHKIIPIPVQDPNLKLFLFLTIISSDPILMIS